MSQLKYKPPSSIFQLTLPGFEALHISGYPIRGLMRCLALCAIYGWPLLGALADRQLAKELRKGRR